MCQPSKQIHPLLWEAVYRVEHCELKVIGATFDGATPNRHFLFTDPPHLMKTVRNCWSSTASSGKVVNVYVFVCLQNSGKPISWKHLQDLYAGGSGASKKAPGLSIVPKRKYEHVFLTLFSKMHVHLAAKVSL